MLRITLAEAADFLGYDTPWIYNTLPKVGHGGTKVFVGITELTKLFAFSFMAQSYETYKYELIVNKKFLKLVGQNTVAGMKDYVHTLEDMHDIVFALKVTKPEIRVFNLISYVHRKVDASIIRADWRDTFKEDVFLRMSKLFVQKKITYVEFNPDSRIKNKELEDEIIKGLQQELVVEKA
jgi:hypothetical protein